jgi:hypothetical protein
MAELKQAQESANQAIQAMLAEATELQRTAGEHLTSETEEAAQLRNEALAEAERIKVGASGDADGIIDRARHQAAMIDGRARQELALRRRQMRDEQELLMRRKHAMLNQLASVSALAVETAENMPDLPEVPETAFAGFPPNSESGSGAAEIESDPTVGNAASAADQQSGRDRADQNEADQNERDGEEGDEEEQAIEGKSDHNGDAAANPTPTDETEFAKASNS